LYYLYIIKQGNIAKHLKKHTMKNLKKLFKNFENLNGAKFVALNNYESKKTKEVAIHTILTNVSVMNAKETDYETLKKADIQLIAAELLTKGIDIEVTKQAYVEMLASAEKNLSANIEDRTAASQAQTDAYISLGNGMKLHKDSGALHIFGMAIQKKVLIAGEPQKPVKSAPKTIAKKMITKSLNLRAGKFRTFIVENVEAVNMSGETITIN
jgi:hypothetical protein